MAPNSRSKGKRGELEFAHFLTDNGFDARRGQQYSGATGEPDVLCPSLPFVHFEVKRTEVLRVWDYMHQSIDDARAGEIPTVNWRKSKHEWLTIMRTIDALRLYRKVDADDMRSILIDSL